MPKVGRRTNECGHPLEAHVALGMCRACYMKSRISAPETVKKRGPKPGINTCGHLDRKHYAGGMCKSCYNNSLASASDSKAAYEKTDAAKARRKRYKAKKQSA